MLPDMTVCNRKQKINRHLFIATLQQSLKSADKNLLVIIGMKTKEKWNRKFSREENLRILNEGK